MLASGCSSPSGPFDQLREERSRWEEQGLDDYSFQFRRVCFCGGPLQLLSVVVRADAVVSVTDAQTGAAPEFLGPEWTGTVDALFEELMGDAPGAATMELRFDATFHYPTYARVDRIANAIDDEYELTLSGLEPAP